MARASKTSCDAEKNASWNNHDKQWKVANTFLSDVIVTAQTVVVSSTQVLIVQKDAFLLSVRWPEVIFIKKEKTRIRAILVTQ